MISPKHSKTVWNSVILAKVSMSCWGTTFFCLLPCSVVAHSQRPTCLQKQTGLCLCDWPCKTTCRWCNKTTCSHVLHAACRFHTLFMSSQLSSQNKITEHLNSSTSQRCAIAELWLGLLSNTEGWSADPDVCPKIHCDMETNLANLTTESQKSTLHLYPASFFH